MADQPIQDLPDVDIALMMMEGNQDGLRALLKKYAGKVRGALAKRYGDVLAECELDEALNVAAFNAWRCAHRYDDTKVSLGAWLLIIARNAARNIIRADIRHKHKDLEYDPGYDPAEWWSDDDTEDGDAAEPEKKQKKLLADFRATVDRLPPLQKAITKADLAAGGSADARRLAAKLGTTLGSIYVSRNKAREAIVKKMMRLGHYQDEPKARR